MGREIRIQLWGIDGPEKDKRMGIEAADAAADLIPEEVLVEEHGYDKYQRRLAILHTADGGTIQEQLLSHGLVWVSDRYCNQQQLCDKWREVQRSAKKKRLGLWREWDAAIVGISDADTVTAKSADGGHAEKIRLWGIDAPETQQRMGPEATQALTRMIRGPITVEGYGYDKYWRLLAILHTPQRVSLQEQLISQGWVWVYEEYCDDKALCDKWRDLQQTARSKRLGLWIDPDPTPPWEWRKQQREWRKQQREARARAK